MTASAAPCIGRAIAALLVVMQSMMPAVAISSGATAGTTSLSTGTWAVAPVLTSTSSNSFSSLLINSLSTKKNSYFWVRNFGSFAVQSFTISQTVTQTGRSPTVEIRSCDGVWDTTKDTCSGTITTLLSTGDGLSGSAQVPIALTVGAAVELAAYPTKNGMQTTISASVSRSSLRGATTFGA